MARVSGKSSKAKRTIKRTKGKFAGHVFWDEPEERTKPVTKPKTKPISTARLRREYKRAKAKRVRERKEPKPPQKEPVKKTILRKIDIVSRKGQPRVSYAVEAIERKSYLKSVSSSWLSTIGYLYGENVGTFTTKTGRQYKILDFDFETFEEWYYAHSKGTFFNERIKDNYKIVGTL